jgi:hypothetical protein
MHKKEARLDLKNPYARVSAQRSRSGSFSAGSSAIGKPAEAIEQVLFRAKIGRDMSSMRWCSPTYT